MAITTSNSIMVNPRIRASARGRNFMTGRLAQDGIGWYTGPTNGGGWPPGGKLHSPCKTSSPSP